MAAVPRGVVILTLKPFCLVYPKVHMEAVWPAGKVRPSERGLEGASEALEQPPRWAEVQVPSSHPGCVYSFVDG